MIWLELLLDKLGGPSLGGTMLLEIRLEPKSLQFSLWGHTLVTLLNVIRRAEVVQVLENLKGWRWLSLQRGSHGA